MVYGKNSSACAKNRGSTRRASDYAINPTPEQALRSNRAVLPARVIAALGPSGDHEVLLMTAKCAQCGNILNDQPDNAQREPCTECGSLGRVIDEEVESRVDAGSMVVVKGYKGGMSKRKGLRFEDTSGKELSVSLGRLVTKTRVIDHEANLYAEFVIDPATGEVLHRSEESLRGHTGHGSDRKKGA